MAILGRKADSLESQPSAEKDGVKEVADVSEDFVPATPEEEEAVIRKLDWHLLPYIFLLYMLSVLDRSNLGNAKLAGMEDDIDLGGLRYNWLGTIFYISCKCDAFALPDLADNPDRYLLAMDVDRLEGLPTTSILLVCRFYVGFRGDHSSDGI